MNGKTSYERHLSAYFSSGVASEELQNPPCLSPQFQHIWQWFVDLNSSRFNYIGMSFAYAPIQYSEIKSYIDLIDESISKDEIKILKMIDSVFLTTMNETKR